VAALIVTFACILLASPTARSQTVDEMANPGKAYMKCLRELKAIEDSFNANKIGMGFDDRIVTASCTELLQNKRGGGYDQAVQKVEQLKARIEQANALSRQWQERYNVLTPLLERAEAECRSSYFSSSAACQSRDRYRQQREEAAFNQRKAEEIGKRIEPEYDKCVKERDAWAGAYWECQQREKDYGRFALEQDIENQRRKCNTLLALAEQFPSAGTSGPTTPQPTTRKPQTTTKPPAPTTRTVKIGYVNYQKLPGFTVTVNGTTKSCSAGFDTSRPFGQGEGDCSFEVPAGPCSISVQASGYVTQSFQHTCDKDQTMMTTLSKTP
jgi:hypothetical protein